jgi:tetratricopeptide (TPR) repeat protein
MQDFSGAASLSELVAAIGDAADVRAALDARPPRVEPELLPAVKLQVDTLVYADRDRASRLVEAAAWAAERLGDDASRAFADAARARLLYAQARYRDAERLFADAAAALRAGGRRVDAAALARQRIAALMHLGEYDEAFGLAREARAVLRRSGERRLLAEHEANVGLLYYHLDRHAAALRCFDRAQAIFTELGEAVPLAYLDHNRAAALFELDRLDEALDLYARAGEVYRAHGLETTALQVELAAAYIEYLKGHYHKALRQFHAAQERAGGALNEVDLALTDLDLAEVYLHLNAYPEASAAADRAAERFAAAGMARELGTARRVAAVAAAKGGAPERATSLLAEATELFGKTGHEVQAALARLDLAQLSLQRGEWEEAARAAADAGAVFTRAGLAPRRRGARLLEARALLGAGERAAAARIARAALRRAEASANDWVAYQCHHVIAETHAAQGRRPRALESYRRAIDAVERLRSRIVVDDFKSTFLEDKVDLYEGAVRLCLEAETPELVEEAFRTLELAKSRSLADLLSAYLREHDSDGGEGGDLRRRFQQLVDELAWRRARRERGDVDAPPGGARRRMRRLDRGIEACEVRVAEAFRQLQVQDSRYADLQRPHVVEPGELRGMISEGEALVEFAAAGGRVSAIVATRDGMRAARDLAALAEVDALMDGLRFQIEKFAYGREFAERELHHLRRGADLYLARLYDALLRPLEGLVGDRDLIVVPHGRLHYVPMHALLRDGEYVVERRGVSYAPSATVYALCSAMPKPSGRRALICGLADASAPEIERELEALCELFPDAHVLAGAEATRGAIARLAEGCGVVHLASHARFRADNPMLSSLQLADGDLTFYDVFTLRLAADIVVLSGCNTGMAAVGAGDELHGLMRGFLYAGAPTLLISMWAADDAATSGLMRDFYAGLGAGATKRAALRAAQLAALERHPHPYYWAPFVLLGRAV